MKNLFVLLLLAITAGLHADLSMASDSAESSRVVLVTGANRGLGLEFARQGFGCVLLISASVERDLAQGRLVRVSEAHDFGVVAVRVMMRDRYPSPAARAFRQLLLDERTSAQDPR